MLFLVFDSGDNRYSIRADEIIEIIPLVNLLRLPRTPPYFPGLLNYQGNIVPVLDLGVLLGNESHRLKMSTRIVMMTYRTGHIDLTVGLILDNIVGTVRRKEAVTGAVALLPDKTDTHESDSQDTDTERMITRFMITRMIPQHTIEEILHHYIEDSPGNGSA